MKKTCLQLLTDWWDSFIFLALVGAAWYSFVKYTPIDQSHQPVPQQQAEQTEQ